MVSRTLKCAQHPGDNRWCFINPDKPTEHIALGLEEITLWACKIVRFRINFSFQVTYKLNSMTMRLILTASAPLTASALMICMNVVAFGPLHQRQLLIHLSTSTLPTPRLAAKAEMSQLLDPLAVSSVAFLQFRRVALMVARMNRFRLQKSWLALTTSIRSYLSFNTSPNSKIRG